jgi:hypothetical protein
MSPLQSIVSHTAVPMVDIVPIMRGMSSPLAMGDHHYGSLSPGLASSGIGRNRATWADMSHPPPDGLPTQFSPAQHTAHHPLISPFTLASHTITPGDPLADSSAPAPKTWADLRNDLRDPIMGGLPSPAASVKAAGQHSPQQGSRQGSEDRDPEITPAAAHVMAPDTPGPALPPPLGPAPAAASLVGLQGGFLTAAGQSSRQCPQLGKIAACTPSHAAATQLM